MERDDLHPTRDRVDAILDHVATYRSERAVEATAVHIRLRRLAHRMENETRRILAPQGLEFWELPVLSGLIRHDGSLGVGQLQDIAQVTSGAITQRLTKMEQAGSIRRSFDPVDRRQVRVEITEAGRERFRLLVAAMGEVEEALFGAVSEDTLGPLGDLLRTVTVALEGADPTQS